MINARTFAALFLILASLNVEASWTSFVLHINEGTETSARRTAMPDGSWLDGVCWISVPKWEEGNLRSWGRALNFCVTGKRKAATSATFKVDKGTHNWTSFVVHVKEGEVEGEMVGGKCMGPDKNGKKRTGGCARWRASLPGAKLAGECWIRVSNLMRTWGHELGHCSKGSWHK